MDNFNSFICSRKQIILKAIINDYVETAEPIGSKMLESRYGFGVKSATLRNEMAELADLGYLRQLHTSSGRIPSDLGYRFYVDKLMNIVRPSKFVMNNTNKKLAVYRSEVEIIIEQTCRVLSMLAKYTSVATQPALRDAAISRILINKINSHKLLVLVVLDDGRIIHEPVDFKVGTRTIDIDKANNYLTSKLEGLKIDMVSKMSIEPNDHEIPVLGALFEKILRLINSRLSIIDELQMHLEGASYIMQQPEFKDVERLEQLLSVLEKSSAFNQVFSTVYESPRVTVIIGSENPVNEMRDCSLVACSYKIGGRVAGALGVFGPTRMDYNRAVGAVEIMAHNLGDLLTSLSS